ncbi:MULTISPECIES: immunoglobulin domain-containing family protein [Kitasatospora]|uniref:ABC transporter n=1 Tax=Kitasatospora cystarginea TaxID=58350 RepID=A0ABN3EAA1_9ACTN
MIALIRYSFATVLHTQRYLAPLLLFTGLMGVLTANGSGPLPPAYASSAGALFVASTWLTTALIGIDSPVQRAIVVVGSGRAAKVLAGSIATVLISCLFLMVFGLLFPLWVGSYHVRPADLLLGVIAQLTCTLTGIAIGLPCSRLVLRRQGVALLLALALVMGFLFTHGVPPVNRLFRLMATSTDSTALLARSTGMLAVATALCLASACATHYLTSRRE